MLSTQVGRGVLFPPNVKVGEADVVLHFETNDMLNAGRFGVILEDIVALARSPDFFGLDVDVRIAELSTGSLTARLTMICSIAASLSAMGSFALALQEHMNSPTDNIGQHVAEMMVDDGVASIDIVTTTHHVQVNRNDNPAVSALEAIREEGAMELAVMVRALTAVDLGSLPINMISCPMAQPLRESQHLREPP